MEPEGSLPCSQGPSTGPYPEPDRIGTRPFLTFRNKLLFLLWGVVSPTPNPKLEDHPFSAVRDCLFSIFVATLHIWRPSPPSATWGRFVPWWQANHLNKNLIHEEIKRKMNSGNACYHSVQKPLSSLLLLKNLKIRIYKTIILPLVLYGCETWSLTLRKEHRLKET
jgi:hypothetical protein